MKGIDISAWQTDIDWQAVKDAGIEFAILKLGQNCQLDSMFVDHINNAVANGLKVGLYVYSKATCTEDAQNEAEWTLQQVNTYLDGKCPEMGVWFDAEDNCMDGADINVICTSYVEYLKNAVMDMVGVYTSYNWLNNSNIDADIINCPIWMAQYNNTCDFDHPNLKIWQYTDHFSDDLPYDGNEYFD